MQLQTNDIIFHNWKVKNVIGVGSFGTVYEIEREEFGHIYRAAAKVISIPDESERGHNVLRQGMTEENIIEYYRSLVEDIIKECDLMECMKGDSHIVSYEDHYVEQSENGKRWTIYIRMELLKPLLAYIADGAGTLKRKEVVRLGIDICQGLETCQKFNIVHRDIKLENIFVSDTGHYKLGDFGISKVMEESENAVSQKGTRFYMAPEIVHGKKYDARVDIYSLGLVLFRLMNDNRAPFLPQYPEMIRLQDKEEALQRRLAGEKIPNPCNADEYLGSIIKKACSFHPEKRYQNPEDMRKDLIGILEGDRKVYPKISVKEDAFPFRQNTMTETITKTLCVQDSVGIYSLIHCEEAGKKHRKSWLREKAFKTKSIIILLVGVFIIFATGARKISEYHRSVVVAGLIDNMETKEKSFARYVNSEIVSEGRKAASEAFRQYWLIVPKVEGLAEAEAVERLTEAGYTAENIQISYIYSNETEKGVVTAQNTPNGTQARRNSTIAIHVGLGKKPSAVFKSKGNEEDSGWIWKAID